MKLAPNVDSLEIQSEKRERTFIKLIVGGLLAIVLLVVFAYVGLSLFHQWQERHSVRRAAAFLSGGDTNAAALSARRALQMNPGNMDATRLMAQIAERTGDRTAVNWWRKVVDTGLATGQDILAFARAALSVNDLASAEKALRTLDATSRTTPDFHALAAKLAQTQNDAAKAEAHWLKAIELAGDNKDYQLQLALTRLAMSDPTKRVLAHKSLAALRTDPIRRAEATRALVLEGLANQMELDQVEAMANELQAYPDATFADRLLYLEALRQSKNPGFQIYLEKLEKEAVPKPADLASLLTWMADNGNAQAAVEFAKKLPEGAFGWPVYPALAAAYVSSKDWPDLEELARTTRWPPSDFLRHAYLSRALREQDTKFAAKQEWLAAQKEAASQPQALFILARTAASWGWDGEMVDLLWLLAKNEDTKIPALQTLYEHYTKLGDTAGLYPTLLRLVESLPNDLVLQNNLAQVCLLLGTDLDRANKIAAEVKEKEPHNGAFVSTYAFSLYRKGDIEGALKTMERLDPNQLRDPAVAIYYGLALSAMGRTDEAQNYLNQASEADLLPEEKALVLKARGSSK